MQQRCTVIYGTTEARASELGFPSYRLLLLFIIIIIIIITDKKFVEDGGDSSRGLSKLSDVEPTPQGSKMKKNTIIIITRDNTGDVK